MSNKLRHIREREGLSRAELSRLADVSERTLQRGENGQIVTGITKSRILNALNRREGRLKDYEMSDLFDEPDGLDHR